MAFLVAVWLWMQAPAAGGCGDAADCRRQSVEAVSRGEFELAHDLAWRAVQKGKPNDPDLMLVLARAQSLSGRPGDAIVMLGRLVDLGRAPDVVTDPDFRRVRALNGWPELEARITGKPLSAPSAPSVPSAPAAAGGSAPPTTSASPAPAAAPAAPLDALVFSAPGVEPFALAHDSVSRRFVLGDRQSHRLLVVDEVSRNVVNYVSAATAGFYDQLTAFAIDARRGDLWVASARGDGGDSDSIVHKLQLVSGRALQEVRAPGKAGGVRFVAVTATPDGTVYALDAAADRLFRARAGARTFEEVMRLDGHVGAALTAADDRTLYVASEKGLLRVDPVSRTSVAVTGPEQLTGFDSLAWRSGSLLGVERVGASYLVVRIKLDPAGTRAQLRQVLAASPTATVGTLAGDSFYYLSDAGTIRRLPLR